MERAQHWLDSRVDHYGSLVAWATLTWIILDRLGLTWICLIGVALTGIVLAGIALTGIALTGIALAGIALARIALARIALTASRVVTHRCILFDCREDGAGGAESKDQLVRPRLVPHFPLSGFSFLVHGCLGDFCQRFICCLFFIKGFLKKGNCVV